MTSRAESTLWDCIIVGAGPAGLNAALVLGRARRRVVVLDTGQPRNYATHEMHGVLGHDGLDPADLRACGRAELGRHGVDVVSAEVLEAGVLDGVVRLGSGRGVDVARTILLATGMLDEVPDIPGFAGVWGTSAHTCRTAMASSTATSASPCWPPAPAGSTSPFCCASGPPTSCCSATARTTSPTTSSRVCARSASRSSRRRSSRWTATMPGTCGTSVSTTARRSSAMRCSSTWLAAAQRRRSYAGLPAARRGLHRRRLRAEDDGRWRLRRGQLRRSAGARAGGRRVRRHRRGRHQRPPGPRGRRPRARGSPRSGACLRGPLTRSHAAAARATKVHASSARRTRRSGHGISATGPNGSHGASTILFRTRPPARSRMASGISVQRDRPVDDGRDRAGLDQFSERVEVGAVLLRDERPESLAYEGRQRHGA